MDNIQSSIQQPVKHVLNGKIEEDKLSFLHRKLLRYSGKRYII